MDGDGGGASAVQVVPLHLLPTPAYIGTRRVISYDDCCRCCHAYAYICASSCTDLAVYTALESTYVQQATSQ